MTAREPGYETRDWKVKTAFIAGALVLLVLIAGHFLSWGTLELYTLRRGETATPDPRVHARELPPAPRLQVNPERDMAALRALEDDRLTTYGWVDRPAGTVHTPIERAMERLAAQGLPARPRDRGRP